MIVVTGASSDIGRATAASVMVVLADIGHLGGSVNLARHVLPVMRAQQAGTLMFMGSVIGLGLAHNVAARLRRRA